MTHEKILQQFPWFLVKLYIDNCCYVYFEETILPEMWKLWISLLIHSKWELCSASNTSDKFVWFFCCCIIRPFEASILGKVCLAPEACYCLAWICWNTQNSVSLRITPTSFILSQQHNPWLRGIIAHGWGFMLHYEYHILLLFAKECS